MNQDTTEKARDYIKTHEKTVYAVGAKAWDEANKALGQFDPEDIILELLTDHDKLRAQLKAAEERNKELEKALIELRIVSVNYGNFTDKYRPRFLEVILETEQALTT